MPRFIHQELASNMFRTLVTDGVVEGRNPLIPGQTHVLIVTDDVGTKTVFGDPKDCFFGRIDRKADRFVGLPNKVVDCSETFKALTPLGVRVWHVALQGLCVYFGEDSRLVVTHPNFFNQLKELLNLPSTHEFPAILILAGGNDGLNVTNPEFVKKWSEETGQQLSWEFGFLSNFLLDKIEDLAQTAGRFYGYLGAGPCHGILSRRARLRDSVVGESVLPFFFHLNCMLESRRLQQLQLTEAQLSQIFVAWLPLPVYEDSAFLRPRTTDEFRRGLVVEAYLMFARDMLNRTSMYCSHFESTRSPSRFLVYACGGRLPTTDGETVLRGCGPHVRHSHGNQMCPGVEKACPTRGLKASLLLPLEQHVSSHLTLAKHTVLRPFYN
jgi:hypothetical protein